MKKETTRAINEFVEFMDEVNGDLPDWPTIKGLLLQLPEMEKALANGGLIRDDNGKWIKDGDRIRVDGYTAKASFSLDSLSWLAHVDGGWSVYLGRDFYEISRLEKL